MGPADTNKNDQQNSITIFKIDHMLLRQKKSYQTEKLCCELVKTEQRLQVQIQVVQ